MTQGSREAASPGLGKDLFPVAGADGCDEVGKLDSSLQERKTAMELETVEVVVRGGAVPSSATG